MPSAPHGQARRAGLVAALASVAAVVAAAGRPSPAAAAPEPAAAPAPSEAPPPAASSFGLQIGATNTYLYGDKDLKALLKSTIGLAFGVQAEGRVGSFRWHAGLLYEERKLTHNYLGSAGRFTADYLTATPRLTLPTGTGLELGGGLAVSQLLRTELGAGLDDELRAKLSHGQAGPLGLLAALTYKYRLSPGLVLTPELTLDEALTSARSGAAVRYEVWTFGVGCLFG